MLLASLLLKLGGYGFIRFTITLLADGVAAFEPFIATCALLGVIFGSLSTLRQIDMKRVIAYSSVAHMNLVVLGIFSGSQQGVEGAVYLMLGHGVVSTALFFVVGVLYDRHHTRLIRYYSGAAALMPLFASVFCLFSLANMSFPSTSNFVGELLVFMGIYYHNSATLLFSSLGIVFSAAYSLFLLNRIIFGSVKTKYMREFADLTRREFAVFATLLLPMLILGVSGTFVNDLIHSAIKALCENGSPFLLALAPFSNFRNLGRTHYQRQLQQHPLLLDTILALDFYMVLCFFSEYAAAPCGGMFSTIVHFFVAVFN